MIKSIKFSDQKYIAPSWEEMGNICFSLAQKIDKERKNQFDRIIALGKGGLTWSRTLEDYLGISDMSTIQIRFYTDISARSNKPVIIQSLPIDVSSEKVLLFDDVADSGKTLEVAKEYLRLCGAKKVSTATLFIKNWVKVKPDYYGELTNAWIVFPHEIREMTNLLTKKWEKENLNKNEVIKRLVKLGLPENQVLYYLR